jgi:two-component system, OmpR family, phosphate regulon sensor histidine kinase PhoR
MSNNVRFKLLIVLMTVSIIGIICVQLFWLYTSLENNREQFKYNVSQTLSNVSNTLTENEITDFMKELKEMAENSGVEPKKSVSRELRYIKRDTENNQEIIYSNTLIQEDYNINKSFFDGRLDTTAVYRYSAKRKTEVIDNKFIDNLGFDSKGSQKQVIENDGRIDVVDKASFNTYYKDITALKAITERIDKDKLYDILDAEIKKHGITTGFEFCVYSKNLPTKVKSDNFIYNKETTYSVPIFLNNEGETNFQLLVSFPHKNEYLFSSLLGLSLLSILFTMIIIGTYYSAITQLKNQKEISQIKSDFINNMTHEFKTPIATINLALDSIKNPKIFNDPEKVNRYLGMIKEENKRMLAQVNNVLQISKLEKNEVDIQKEPNNVHNIIKDATEHVKLLVEDRQGKITIDLEAKNSEVNLNKVHFTNIMVNLLDNAIKYSPDIPDITIKTLNPTPDSIIIKVSDKGQGMGKTAIKRVFEQFYREHTGNIHNVKGHGLGLAYVKRIVEDHNGQITVESEKGKGSTFIIKMPLI